MVSIVPIAPRVFSIGVRISDSDVLSLRSAHHACMLGDTTQPRSPIEGLISHPGAMGVSDVAFKHMCIKRIANAHHAVGDNLPFGRENRLPCAQAPMMVTVQAAPCKIHAALCGACLGSTSELVPAGPTTRLSPESGTTPTGALTTLSSPQKYTIVRSGNSRGLVRLVSPPEVHPSA